MAETRKIIRATREVTVIINGEEFDALLIPKNAMVEVDFSQFPEDDPLRRQVNREKLTEVDLDLEHDLSPNDGELNKHVYRLTKRGAYRLLESL
jgi:hypothetical protein